MSTDRGPDGRFTEDAPNDDGSETFTDSDGTEVTVSTARGKAQALAQRLFAPRLPEPDPVDVPTPEQASAAFSDRLRAEAGKPVRHRGGNRNRPGH